MNVALCLSKDSISSSRGVDKVAVVVAMVYVCISRCDRGLISRRDDAEF